MKYKNFAHRWFPIYYQCRWGPVCRLGVQPRSLTPWSSLFASPLLLSTPPSLILVLSDACSLAPCPLCTHLTYCTGSSSHHLPSSIPLAINHTDTKAGLHAALCPLTAFSCTVYVIFLSQKLFRVISMPVIFFNPISLTCVRQTADSSNRASFLCDASMLFC